MSLPPTNPQESSSDSFCSRRAMSSRKEANSRFSRCTRIPRAKMIAMYRSRHVVRLWMSQHEGVDLHDLGPEKKGATTISLCRNRRQESRPRRSAFSPSPEIRSGLRFLPTSRKSPSEGLKCVCGPSKPHPCKDQQHQPKRPWTILPLNRKEAQNSA